MRRVALKIGYIGSKFHGYQRQPNYRTVEGELLHVFKQTGIIENTWSAHYSVAGRTDKGVHSTGNVISFITDSDIHIDQINGLLPDDIKILATARVPYGFKVRFPETRTYTYIQPINPCIDEKLDIEAMKSASKYFIGEHNFRNFSKKHEKNPNRIIKSFEIEQVDNNIVFTVTGVSFLWNMVRKMITSLIYVGRNEFEEDIINELLQPKELRQFIRLKPAAANGLILSDVSYKNINFEENSYAKSKMIEFLKSQYMYNLQEMMADKTLINLLK